MSNLKIALLSVAAILVVVVIGVAGWQFGWWLNEKNVDRQVQIENRNTGTQTAWRDEAIDLSNQADLLPEGAPARARLDAQACELIARLTGSYRDGIVVAIVEEKCL